MKYILSAKEMRSIDSYTSESIGVSSEVLMERAALVCAEEIRSCGFDTSKILIVCGMGNNGADGLALARIINRFYKPEVFLAGSYNSLSGLVKKQYDSAARSHVKFTQSPKFDEYTLIIDALFGTGLSRDIEGEHLDIINKVNSSGAKVISLDMPSGVDATSGRVLGGGVNADITVSFAYTKLGQILYPGAEKCGALRVRDIGIYIDLCDNMKHPAFTYTKNDLSLIPKRRRYSNKSTYGRVFVVAGSENMSGAALLSAKGAYKSGCGIVSVFTHKKIADTIRTVLPEAIVCDYIDEKVDFSTLYREINNASALVIGPGLSKSENAKRILRYTLENAPSNTVIDADALNIISEHRELLAYIKGKIVTPHLGEAARLMDKSIDEIKDNLISCAKEFSDRYNCICVLKDTRTVVAVPNQPVFINTAGNSGLAKGGSGDTLTGIIASLMSQGMESADAARIGVFLHAYAADLASDEHGEYAMLASDVSEAVGRVMSQFNK
ncbi:MAG: NAD(P)H-hydrate dehydratase [Ruminococcaceae bacterium]|nr:NAD(P)H-hydrate dehydratase [Oscillospiraceae bacterium]